MARAAPRLYVKLDVDYYDNARVIDAGPDAELLYVRCLCLAKRFVQTNGVIAFNQVARMGFPQVNSLAERLVEVGLWRKTAHGYKIVGWLDRNNSAKEVLAISDQRRRSGTKGGQANGSRG